MHRGSRFGNSTILSFTDSHDKIKIPYTIVLQEFKHTKKTTKYKNILDRFREPYGTTFKLTSLSL